MTTSLSRQSAKLAILRPLSQPRNLTREVVERLSTEIMSGKLTPGARLPTEHEMIAALGVSRTVVREAVSALRAEGLVVTRQGVGAFVAVDVERRPFRIDPDGLSSIGEVLKVVELRMGVEIESAGLAAERAAAAQLRRIRSALGALDAAIARGEPGIDEDVEFHRAIARATRNPQFVRFLEFLGRFIIPRRIIRIDHGVAQRAYLASIQDEHRAIFTTIQDRDPVAARAAMRQHLTNSRERYRRLAAGSAGR
ncbi:MAG: FadR family transcriptional regulator [Proteobacteria bacterium]|nr:FadR family transcriptional regulator [Pseudomonadota bacterium]